MHKNNKLFDEFLEKFDSALPILLAYTNLSNTEIAQINAIKSYYFNDLTANKSLVSIENNVNRTSMITLTLFSTDSYLQTSQPSLGTSYSIIQPIMHFGNVLRSLKVHDISTLLTTGVLTVSLTFTLALR